jgi:hypothetical protein
VIGNGDLLPEARRTRARTRRQLSRVVLVAASSSTRRIVSSSSAAARARAGRTPDGAPGRPGLSSSGSDSAITGSRCRAFRLFV